MQVGDTVTVVTISGEYVGELESFGSLVLKNHEWLFKQKGYGFNHGVAVTGKENPEQLTKCGLCYSN